MTRAGFAEMLLLALGLATGAALLAAPATGADAREELRELRSRIEALQKRLAGAEETRVEAADALRESERAISEARRNLRELAQRVHEANTRLARLRAESGSAGAALREQQALLSRLLHRQYLDGRAEPLRLLLNREDPNRIARKMHYLGYLSRARAELIAGLRASQARVDELAREAAREAAAIAAIAAEQSAENRRLEQQRQARARALAGATQEIQRQRREIGTLRRDENRLTKLVESIGRVVARKPAAPRQRNERVPDSSLDGSPFERLKGRLRLPVRGELANRFGSPRADGGLTWKGLFIAARPGEEVRAIAAGRVVFADWLRGFGNLLIIDHGGAYLSLYGNNESLYKRVGDVISGGDPIAIVGNSGGNADSGLYFEMRHEGRPLDPLTWVNAR